MHFSTSIITVIIVAVFRSRSVYHFSSATWSVESQCQSSKRNEFFFCSDARRTWTVSAGKKVDAATATANSIYLAAVFHAPISVFFSLPAKNKMYAPWLLRRIFLLSWSLKNRFVKMENKQTVVFDADPTIQPVSASGISHAEKSATNTQFVVAHCQCSALYRLNTLNRIGGFPVFVYARAARTNAWSNHKFCAKTMKMRSSSFTDADHKMQEKCKIKNCF